MGIATITRAGGAIPPTPPAAKLGDFSQIFDICFQASSEAGRSRSSSRSNSPPASRSPSPSPPSTPSPLAVAPYNGIDDLFGGLCLSSIDQETPMSEGTTSMTTEVSETPLKVYGSPSEPEDGYSTPASTPPSVMSRHAKTAALVTAVPDQSGFVAVSLLGAHGTTGGFFYLPDDLPLHRLAHASFFKYAPLHFDPNCVAPSYLSTPQNKLDLLETRLFYQYELDAETKARSGILTDAPLHIFIDLSNIIIGFYDCLKASRGIHLSKRVKAPPFFFEGLARILERGRPTMKKILAGSVADRDDHARWPAYMRDAEAAGYEMNILNRVTKAIASPRQRIVRGNSKYNNGWTTSDPNSSDDGFSKAFTKQGEQAVDEMLQLKICHSVLDDEPSTMVLATGDAAVAEYSDGFLKHIERALKRGWNVELVSWRKNISSSWRGLQRNPMWASQFRIIELDEFAEELLAIFVRESWCWTFLFLGLPL